MEEKEEKEAQARCDIAAHLSSGEILAQDLAAIYASPFIRWESLRGASVFVTGATGLIGFTLVGALLYASQEGGLGLTVTALVRDEKRARERFKQFEKSFDSSLRFAVGTAERMPPIDGNIDFIVHGASPTSGKFFTERSAETLIVSFEGTKNALELARQKGLKSFVYLSSMEIYGLPQKGHKVTESDIGTFSPFDARNSYPIGKLASEALCYAYYAEHGVPAKALRLTQTLGPGASREDARIFAYMGRCAQNKEDIILKTEGKTERSYLYTADAATAILAVMLNGNNGAAYNAADVSTYCSIAEMAQGIAANAGVAVRFELEDAKASGYPDTLYMDLDTTALKGLGWRPQFPLFDKRH